MLEMAVIMKKAIGIIGAVLLATAACSGFPCGFGVVLVLATACSGEPTLTVDETSQAVINGSLVGDQEQADKGLVSLSTPEGTCSGILLVNDWVLTAGHCIAILTPAMLANGTAGLRFGGLDAPVSIEAQLIAQTRLADAFYFFGGFAGGRQVVGFGQEADLWDGPDLALLHLASPFTIGGSTTGFRNELYTGGVRALL